MFAHAATLTVTSTADNGSAGTLRAQIAAAADGDTIAFDASLDGQAVLLDASLGPLSVTKSVEIAGPASGRVALDLQNAACPILQSFDPAVAVTLRNLEFRNMKNTSGAYQQPQQSDPKTGPAVSILGAATIEDCFFHDLWMSQTEGSGGDTKSDGGSALRVAGNLSMARCEFRNNNLSANTGGAGSAVVVAGETVSIADCSFVGNGASAAPKAGALVVLGSTTDFTLDRCLFATNAVQFGQGGILFRQDVSSGTFRIRNSIFRAFSGSSGWKNGGAVGCEGGGTARFVFENDEFSDIRYGGWGGAVRIATGNGAAVFANCTFSNCSGNEWGGTVDTRCKTLYVNCTFAGNVNGHSNNNGSGTAFAIGNVSLLNTVCAWNYSNGGSVQNDTSRYGGTLRVLNSYNNAAGSGPSATDNAMGYDAGTLFFKETFQTVSAIRNYTLATAIQSPVLTKDAADPDGVPGVVEISPYGVLAGTGWPVKHDADWENVAYTKDGGANWTALEGSAASATTLLAADARGLAYDVDEETGLPVAPIGAAREIPNTDVIPVEIVGYTIDSASVTWTEAAASLSLHFAESTPSATVSFLVSGGGLSGAVWTNVAVSAQSPAVAVVLTGLLPGTEYSIGLSVLADGETDPIPADGIPVTTASIPAPAVALDGTAATASSGLVIPATSPWTSARFVFTPVYGGDPIVVPAASLADLSAAATVAEDTDYAVTLEVVREGFVARSEVASLRIGTTLRLDEAPFNLKAQFTAGGYDGESALTNFPVLVRLSSALLPGFDPTAIAASGLRFRDDATGLLLAHEVDTWADAADGECTVWVSLPVLEGRDTRFTMFAKPRPSASPASRDPRRVWLLADYIGVWHFGEPSTDAAGIATCADATGNGNDASNKRPKSGYVASAPVFLPGTTNLVGTAIRSRGGLWLPTDALAAWADDAATAFSAEAWVHGNGTLRNDTAKIFSSYSSWSAGAHLRIGDRYYYGGGNYWQWSSEKPVSNEAWTHIAAAWSSAGGGYVRLNGDVALSGKTGADDTGLAEYSLTSSSGAGEIFEGFADEFRVRRGVSSADWAQAVYDTSRPGSDFLSYGPYGPAHPATVILVK